MKDAVTLECTVMAADDTWLIYESTVEGQGCRFVSSLISREHTCVISLSGVAHCAVEEAQPLSVVDMEGVCAIEEDEKMIVVSVSFSRWSIFFLRGRGTIVDHGRLGLPYLVFLCIASCIWGEG